MRIKEILEMADTGKRISALCKDPLSESRHMEEWEKEFDGEHKILHRANKTVGEKPIELEDGTISDDTRKTVLTAKIALPLQKGIVRSAVIFSVGGGIILKLDNKEDKFEKAFKLMNKTLKDVKIDSFNMKLVERLSVESKVAELWYVSGDKDEGTVNKKVKTCLLCSDNGDEIYPHYNEFGDMDAFTRKYVMLDELDRTIHHIDIYTAEKQYSLIKSLSGNSYTTTEVKNPYGKIPIIFYDQEESEWKDVQIMVDRVETICSKLADMNDYFSAPTIKSKGIVASPPDKDEIGKWIQIEGEESSTGNIAYGDVDYLVWKNSPETVKFEVELLLKFINSLTSTPDISFDNIKNINGSISGVALKTMFLDAILKGKGKQTLVLGEGFNRRVNLLKAILSVTNTSEKSSLENMEISVIYKSVLPEDIIELIEALSTSRPGENLISRETAIQKHPFVEDLENEKDLLDKENQEQEGSYNG